MPACLEIAQALAQQGGRSDTILRAAFGRRELLGMVLVLVPNIGLGRTMLAEKAIVAEPVEKEAVALGADLLHSLFDRDRTGTERRSRNSDSPSSPAVRTRFRSRLVVVLHPLARSSGIDEGKRQRAHAEPRGLQNRLAARTGHPQRRMRLSARASAPRCAAAPSRTCPHNP